MKINSDDTALLTAYLTDMEDELARTLSFWIEHTIDDVNGGFFGKIDHENKVSAKAPRGAVLNARILWAFSAAYNATKNAAYKTIADRAFHYFLQHFIDEQFGGIYWTVNFDGTPLDTKKQTYAIAFAVYGLSEYYKCSGDALAKDKAIELYNVIQQQTSDKNAGGYFEAFSQNWQPIDDLRLSAKDANEKKSMNTHLHVIEGYANLYSIWPDGNLKKQIEELLTIFSKYIIDKNTHHLILFFGENWTVKSETVSYGHDIEAAWLLQECAEIIHHKDHIENFKAYALKIALASEEGLDKDGGLWYEFEPAQHHLIKEKHWWPQSEAMIGFLNAWQINGDEHFLQQSISSWNFTKKYIVDEANGEWVWGVYEDYAVMKQEDKAGLWKCPYHNSRACLEIIKRLASVLNN